MDRIEQLKQEVKQYFTSNCHGFDHTLRVYNFAIKIAQKENVDIEIIKATTLLHDIARDLETKENKQCHAEKGAEMCKPILKKLNFTEEQIKVISDAIKTHRFSKKQKPNSKIGEILQDADRLDVLGAIGIARVFTGGGERRKSIHNPKIKPAKEYTSTNNTSINHFYEKVLNIKPDTFHTETARQIAKSRYNYTKEFINRFLKEWDGKI